MNDQVTVCYENDMLASSAQQFALQHQLEVTNIEQAQTTFILHFRDDFIELIDQSSNTSIHVDFLSGALAHRRKYGGGKGQAIAKAIGVKQYKLPLTILDATAGLAKDAFVLACLGCSVTMLEQNPVIAKLVLNALQNADDKKEFQDIKKQGFELIHANANTYLKSLTIRPDIIYIDPMYPERKKSAAVKKNMQILQKLIGHNESKALEETALLNLALEKALKRVVVKRPKGAPNLTNERPTMCIESKITRYDVYVLT